MSTSYQDYQASAQLLESSSVEERKEALANLGIEEINGSIPLDLLPSDQIEAVYLNLTDGNGNLEAKKDRIQYIRKHTHYTKLKGRVSVDKATEELVNKAYDDVRDEAEEIVDDVGYTLAQLEIHHKFRTDEDFNDIPLYLLNNFPARVAEQFKQDYPVEDTIQTFSILDNEIETTKGTPSIKGFN